MPVQREAVQRETLAVRSSTRVLLSGLLCLLTAWLFWPALAAVHLEAFSASLHAMAILLHRHGAAGLGLADQGFPITTEYLYLSRSGLVDALGGLMRLTGVVGDGVFRLLMLGSMVVYVGSSLVVARRWSGERLELLFVVLVLTPGMVEIAFSFADNLPSAALAMLAISLIGRERTPAWRWLVIGVVFAMAILVRVDAVLIAPVLGICLLQGRPRASAILMRTVGLLAGVVLIFALAQGLTPFRLSDSVRITAYFAALQKTFNHGPKTMLAYFFGPITLLLCLLGVIRNTRTRGRIWSLGLTILPGLFYLYAIMRATELRVFLLLGTPAVLVHGAAGIRVLWEQWRSTVSWRRISATVAAILVAVVMVGPVSVKMLDGPRSVLGRLWTPIIWHEWQRTVDEGMHEIDGAVASIQPGQTLLAVSSHYNADRYLRLRLLEDGYDILPTAQAPAVCHGIAEVFRKGDRTVFHLRTENPYLILQQQWHLPLNYAAAFQVVQGLDCMQGTTYQHAILVNWGPVPAFFGGLMPGQTQGKLDWEAAFPTGHLVPTTRRGEYGIINVQPLDAATVEALRQSAATEVQLDQQTAVGWAPLTRYADLHNKVMWRFWAPPQ